MGGGRNLVADLEDLPQPAGCKGPIAVGGDLHRWNLLPREKRGSEVGKTKRGKGSKLMVVVERKGIPLGVSVASA